MSGKFCVTHAVLIGSLVFAPLALADDKKDERGGTCADAKQQYEYFCEKKGFENDIMLNAPIACNNAKRNMAAACDGKSEADNKYEFKDSK